MMNMKKINEMLNPKKEKKKTEKEIFETAKPLPGKYKKGLSKKEKKEKTENVKETKKLLKEGKKEQASERPTVKSNKKSSYTIRFKKKFPNIKT